MSINEMGRKGEELARLFIKNRIKADYLMQADWMFKRGDEWYVVEVKCKESFQPPPFKGHGLNAYQADMRIKAHKELGLRCMFLVFDVDGHIYWQWLDELEKTDYFTTRNNVRIYDIQYFKCAGSWENKTA